jgi:hypothetical protein
MGALSLLSALAMFGWIAWAARRRPVFLFAGVFVIWQFGLKVVATVYLDLFGPVHSTEIDVDIGGNGSSTLLLVLFLWIPLLALYVCLGPRLRARPPPPEPYGAGANFGDVGFWVFVIFLALLYGDLLRIGNIPYFSGIDRFDYQGGVFHNFLFYFTWMVAFLLGYLVARGRIVTGAWDPRFIVLVLVLFLYLFLTGHRFGAYYVTLSFIALGVAGCFYARMQGWPVASPVQHSSLQRLIRSPAVISGLALVLVGFIAAAMFNNLFVVRDYGSGASEALEQRILVQPVELYWLTWDRWMQGEVINGSEAIYFMFNDPFDAARNSGIQYLMFLYLGETQAFERFVLGGQDYAGGYPEIFIELGGVWIALAAAVIVAIISGLLYRLIVSSVARGAFLTAVMALYLCYGMLGIYLGGMLNFLLVWTYWAKASALLFAILIDHLFDRAGRRFIPWVVIPRRPRPALRQTAP